MTEPVTSTSSPRAIDGKTCTSLQQLGDSRYQQALRVRHLPSCSRGRYVPLKRLRPRSAATDMASSNSRPTCIAISRFGGLLDDRRAAGALRA